MHEKAAYKRPKVVRPSPDPAQAGATCTGLPGLSYYTKDKMCICIQDIALSKIKRMHLYEQKPFFCYPLPKIPRISSKKEKTLEDILDFHVKFERIHPFQDGNGRVGRLILFKECLKYQIVPFIIEDDLKMFYYRGLKEWDREKGYLTDTCLTAQDRYKAYLDYFRIKY